jgi:YhcH/YjgK/YiaL family protein
MAIFGTLEVVKKQLCDKKFDIAFEYLEKVLKDGTVENKRLIKLPIGAFEKVDLDNCNFALEQVYNSKKRNECFFESHKQYIDVQFILQGEEIIEVSNSNDLVVESAYSEKIDLVKYKDTSKSSHIMLKKGDVAIFFPEDAHMPCVKVKESLKVIKTVVKVQV